MNGPAIIFFKSGIFSDESKKICGKVRGGRQAASRNSCVVNLMGQSAVLKLKEARVARTMATSTSRRESKAKPQRIRPAFRATSRAAGLASSIRTAG
jgi:hypothetical protein